MRKHILIIDDDTELLKLLNELLTMEGYRVTTVTDAPDIENLLARYRPDLLLIDYLLPHTSGSKLIHHIKQLKEYCNLPVLMLSAWPESLINIEDGDCNAFISKPFDLWTLLRNIDELTRLNAAC